MVSNISTLAIVLIELIACGLDSADLFSLRLACRELNRKTFRCFGHACFTTLRTNLSRESLQRLAEVSEHEQLRHHVEALLIESSSNTGRGYLWNRHPSGYLVPPLPVVETLRNVLLGNLLNCRSFRFHSDHEVINLDESTNLTLSDTIAIILTIIAETGLSLKSFYVDYTRSGGSPIDMKRLDVSRYQTSEFRTGWACLQELILGYTMPHEAVDWTTELILHASSLQKLETGHYFDDTSGLIFYRLMFADRLPRLQGFSLGSGRFTEELLSSLILRFRDSLRVLSLCSVVIISGGTWPAVFGAWRDNLPLLEHMSVKHLGQRGPPKTRIVFPSIGDDPVVPGTGGRLFDLTYRKLSDEQVVVGVACRGPRMHVAFEKLVSATASSR